MNIHYIEIHNDFIKIRILHRGSYFDETSLFVNTHLYFSGNGYAFYTRKCAYFFEVGE